MSDIGSTRSESREGSSGGLGQRVGGGLRRRAARGTVLNAIFLVTVNLLTMLRGIIVAGALTRAQYGVWGIVIFTFGTLLSLKQVGISDKYVQQDEPDQQLAFQKAFTVELVLSLVLALVMLIVVPIMAVAYHEPKLVAPGIVLALTLPAIALQAPVWVYYRRMNFGAQRALQSVDPIIGFVVTIVLAALHFGYWSLVLGMVAGTWAGGLTITLRTPLRLRLVFDRDTLREYFRFSWPLFVATASAAVVGQLTILTGTAALGLAGAGAISLAASMSFYADKVDQIVTETIYPAICAVRGRADVLLEAFVTSNRLALMWGIPFGAGLALFGGDLVHFVLGDRWQPATILIRVFGLTAAVNHIGFNWSAYYNARAQTRPMAVYGLVYLVAFCLIPLPLLALDGLPGFAAGMIVATGVSCSMRAYYVRRLFPDFPFASFLARALTPSAVAAVVVVGVRATEGRRSPAMVGVELAVYAIVTVLATYVVERPLVHEVIGYLRRGPAPAAELAA